MPGGRCLCQEDVVSARRILSMPEGYCLIHEDKRTCLQLQFQVNRITFKSYIRLIILTIFTVFHAGTYVSFHLRIFELIHQSH